MTMPNFNIFIISSLPKEEKKIENKDRLLSRALRKKDDDTEKAMLDKLAMMTEQLKGLPGTSHAGGG